ncbi:MAG: hypothetical protein FWB91_13520 [Defluviitaleaceae bacterium]|nr:hypothetical protein [Defluviitaleaceae bacterium]
MAIVSKYLSSRLQIRDMEDEVFQTMHRVRPDINAMEVDFLKDSISTISIHPAMSAALTISEELAEESDDDDDGQ